MDEDDGMLSAGFAIDTQGAFSELQRFYQFFDAGTIKVLDEMRKVEVATGGMMKLGGATREVAAFSASAKSELSSVKQAADTIAAGIGGLAATISTTGSAATREARALAREKTLTATAGEALIRTLDRETASLGRTKEEMRSAKIEALALAASQQGNTDLADRLLVAARQRTFAAATVAEAEEASARRVAVAMEQQAQALRSADHAHQLFEARVRQGAVAMAVAEREAVTFEATMSRVQNRVDPAAASLTKLQMELDEAKLAFDHARISAEAYAQEQSRLTGAAGKIYGPQRDLANAFQEVGVAQRFTAMETLNLSRQFQDIGVTAAMGMNPLMIMIQQGPQIYDVLETAKSRGVAAGAAFAQMGKDISSYAVTGLARLAPLINPVNLLLAGTAIAVVAVVRSLATYGTAMKQFETTAAGLGRVSGQTAQQLENIAEAAASSGERSISATRDSVNAFAAAGIQGEQTLTSLAGMVDKYAKLTGQDAPTAQAALAEAMKDPARAADTFTQSLGLLNGAQYEHIRQLAAQGDQEKATAELTRILSGDLAANAQQVTGLAHYMDVLGGTVSAVSTMFGRLDQRIRDAGASYDAWLKQHAGGWAVDLFGTGNKEAPKPGPNAGRNQDQIAALNASQSLNTTGMQQFNKLLADQRVLQKGLADTTGLTAAQVQALRHDYAATTDTINANRNASGGWITTQERAHLVAQAQAKLAGARTQTEKAAAQRTITGLQLGTQVLTQQERQTQAMDAYNRVSSRYVKPKTDHHADELVREAKATEAQIRNLYGLADAYGMSGSEALIAEARVKAESAAISKRGDVEAFVDRQIRLAVAERVKTAAQGTAAMLAQAAAQVEVNGMVAAGNVPAERAAELVQQRIADAPLLAAIQAAETKGLTKEAERATKALNAQQDARLRTKAAAYGATANNDDAAAAKELDMLRQERDLIGATDAARVHALATIKATQEAAVRYGDSTNAFAKTYISNQVEIADTTESNARATREWNAALSANANLWDTIASTADAAARGMADAFGQVGRSIGDVATSLTGYYADQARLETEHEARTRNMAAGSEALAREQRLYAIQSSSLQIGAYGDMAVAAKGFFKEGSTGYRTLATAEKVFRAVELGMAIKNAAVQLGLIGGIATARTVATGTAIATDAAFTATSVTGAGIRASADATAAMAKTAASSPFPFNLAGMAVMAAALASLGIATGFLGGGGGKNTLPAANEGTGTVLGDTEAKSESIKRAIDGLKEVDTLMLTSSREMASLLRSIDSQIGGVASLIVRAGDVNASDGVNEGFKTNAVGSVLKAIVPVFGGALASLFGTKTTVVGSGLSGGPQSLDSILNGGFDASYYSDVQKKKKLFGITTGTKYSTQYTGADAGLENQFTLILKNFNSAIAAAAGPLGESTAEIQRRLGGFIVDIGKIDLQGLTGDEIQEKLSAVFGAAADKMALAAFPGFERFQKVGEGAFETLVRVASTVEAVSASLDLLGGSAKGLGLDAKLGLADQFASVGDFNSAADTYFQAFYTKEDQAAAKTAQFAKVFDSLGAAMPETLAGFRQLVDAQDLTTAAGQATYATLLQLAPAFADLKSAMDGAKSAADILSERQDLERKMLELNGDTAAIRALDLAKVDVSNRMLQQQVWALQDAQAAASAAKQLSDAWSSVGDSIDAEIKRIRGITDGAGGTNFAMAMGEFNAATTAARGGDQDAAKLLPGLSQALLKLAGDNATSRQELDRVQAQTAASLETTSAVIAAIAKGNPLTSAGAVAAAAVAANAAAPASSPANDVSDPITQLREEVAKLRSDANAGLAAIAGSTARLDRRFEDVTSASGGDAISVTKVAA